MSKKPLFKNALVSVSDKTGIVEFIKPLYEQGMRVVSTGGTAKLLKAEGVEVVEVSEQTGFPEVMDGRVKTLNPKIHMCLLAREGHSEDLEILKTHNLEPFDLVIGNLYPFEKALEDTKSWQEQVEFIDIGGPSFLRAAAKNFERVTVICDPSDYQKFSDLDEVTLDQRKELAGKIFSHTSTYDSLIAEYLLKGRAGMEWSLAGNKIKDLRYGENPHQTASWYRKAGSTNGIHNAQILQGKELSYNNILDIEAAVSTLREFQDQPACVAVKHNNPCGVAVGESTPLSVTKALAADPVSVFGGIVAISNEVDAVSAEKLSGIFLECIVAPKFSDVSLEIFSKKKNLRLLRWEDLLSPSHEGAIQRVDGGFLIQSVDQVDTWGSQWRIHGEDPSDEVKAQLEFAWKVCAHLKSNAIAICGDSQSLGLGMGQVNRVDAVRQAIERWQNFHPGIVGAVLASDAFFPFADSIEMAADAGIKWVIQPGGSIKDEEVIARAKDRGVNMIFTGKRHFLH